MPRRRRSGLSILLSALLLMLVSARLSPGKPIAIGETTGVLRDDFQLPGGDVVAEKSTSFTVTYDPGGDLEVRDEPNNGVFHPTLHSQVLRDPLSGHLTFFYEFDAPRLPGSSVPIGNENASLTLRSFAGFSTDVNALIFSSDGARVARSEGDGGELTISNGSDGLSGPPTVVIATNATAFDANGSLDLTVNDEMLVFDPANPDGSSIMGLVAHVALSETFQPVAEGAAAIPLPPAAYSGIVALIAALRICHRRGTHAVR